MSSRPLHRRNSRFQTERQDQEPSTISASSTAFLYRINSGFSPNRLEAGELIFGHLVVDVAKQPPFAGLSRSYYRMTAGVRVLGSVLVRGRITAKRGPTGLACAQVDPTGAKLDTLVGLIRLGRFKVSQR